MSKDEGEFKKRLLAEEKWKKEHGFTEDMDHMVANVCVFEMLDEAGKEFWSEIISTGSVRSDLIVKWFGLPLNTCNKLGPDNKLPCLLSAGHKGNHRHYPYVWADESGIIYGEDENRRLNE